MSRDKILEGMGIDTSDAWKGSKIIRSVPHAQVGGLAFSISAARKARRVRKARAALRTCAFPGCGNHLSPQTKFDLCRVHLHARGLCRCSKCQRGK